VDITKYEVDRTDVGGRSSASVEAECRVAAEGGVILVWLKLTVVDGAVVYGEMGNSLFPGFSRHVMSSERVREKFPAVHARLVEDGVLKEFN